MPHDPPTPHHRSCLASLHASAHLPTAVSTLPLHASSSLPISCPCHARCEIVLHPSHSRCWLPQPPRHMARAPPAATVPTPPCQTVEPQWLLFCRLHTAVAALRAVHVRGVASYQADDRGQAKGHGSGAAPRKMHEGVPPQLRSGSAHGAGHPARLTSLGGAPCTSCCKSVLLLLRGRRLPAWRSVL